MFSRANDTQFTGKQQVGILIGASVVAWFILIGFIFGAIEIATVGAEYVSAFSSR